MGYLDKAQLLNWLDEELQTAETRLGVLKERSSFEVPEGDEEQATYVRGVKAALLEVRSKLAKLTF